MNNMETKYYEDTLLDLYNSTRGTIEFKFPEKLESPDYLISLKSTYLILMVRGWMTKQEKESRDKSTHMVDVA